MLDKRSINFPIHHFSAALMLHEPIHQEKSFACTIHFDLFCLT